MGSVRGVRSHAAVAVAVAIAVAVVLLVVIVLAVVLAVRPACDRPPATRARFSCPRTTYLIARRQTLELRY